MGDRTYYSIGLDASGLTDADLDALTGAVEFDRWERDIVADPNRPRDDSARYVELPSVSVVVEEFYCGEAEKVAHTVLAWMREEPAERLRAFTVHESPKYEWLGTLVTFDPKLHGPENDGPAFHVVDADDAGVALLSETEAVRLITDADGSFEALVLALGKHYGPAFDAMVSTAAAKRRETAAAREREAIAARVRECGYPEPPAERVPEADLTRTQRAALDALRSRRNLWPAGRGRWSSGNETPWEQRTLDALVRAGHARWVIYAGSGCLPHIIPA
jgi:hypothetical protein